jgi:hypothetical protein
MKFVSLRELSKIFLIGWVTKMRVPLRRSLAKAANNVP